MLGVSEEWTLRLLKTFLQIRQGPFPVLSNSRESMRMSLLGFGQCTTCATELGNPATSDAFSSQVIDPLGFLNFTSFFFFFLICAFFPSSLLAWEGTASIIRRRILWGDEGKLITL